jgi:hypothetical protein
MTSAVQNSTSADYTEVPFVVRSGTILGLLQSVLVFAFSFASRLLEGTPELIVRAIIVVFGLAATSLLPGIWTRARRIEGIAGAAGIGLMATAVYLLVDSLLLQHIGTYTNRWLAIGGGSNWWYHPVWWMAGTYLSWMGAWALANQADRGGANPGIAFIIALVLTAISGALAVVIGVPNAGWNLGTFAVAFLVGISLTVLVTGLGSKRT